MSIACAENGWVNTADAQKPEVIHAAGNILQNTLYCTLATCSPDGFPWASPVLFTYDPDWNLYWSSAIAARHSHNIYWNRGRVAITIYSSNQSEGAGKGLYFQGTAAEVARDQVEAIMEQLFDRARSDRPHRTAADYLAPSPRRIYRFQPDAAWITGERMVTGNQLVDTKIQLSLADLIGTLP